MDMCESPDEIVQLTQRLLADAGEDTAVRTIVSPTLTEEEPVMEIDVTGSSFCCHLA